MACSGRSATGDTSEIQDPSSYAGERRTCTKSGSNVGRHVGRRVEQRVQFEHSQRALDAAGQLERLVDALGRHARDADQLLGADRPLERRIALRAGRTASMNDSTSRCICRQTSSAMRTSAECENAPKSTSDSSAPE